MNRRSKGPGSNLPHSQGQGDWVRDKSPASVPQPAPRGRLAARRLRRPRSWLLGQDPQRACGGEVRSNTSSSATAPSARGARCSPTPISTNSSPLRPERIRRVRLSRPALAVLAIRIPDRRSSLFRLDQRHEPAGSGSGRAQPSARRPRRTSTQAQAAATSLRLDDVAGRYWQEVGQHHAGADNTERLLG